MTENLESAVSSLSEQTRKLEIASYYTHGDMDKAKKMISGAYKDIYAIKIVFSSTINGAALVFFNPTFAIMYPPFVIVTQSFTVVDMKTNVGWRQFELEIAENLEKKEHDDVLVAHIREGLFASMNLEFCTELNRLREMNDEIAINRHFMKVIQTRMGFQKLSISVDLEPTSSLEMELDSRSSKKLDPRELNKKDEKNEDQDAENREVDEDLAGKEIKLILEGALVLSPVKGKDIKDLMVGDRIMISLIDSNPKSRDLAKAFNAYDEEQQRPRPIPGRIVAYRRLAGGGYKIFAIVAKGIYIKINEDEDNIKVALDLSSSLAGQKAESSYSAMLPLFMTLMVILVLLIGLIVYFVMF